MNAIGISNGYVKNVISQFSYYENKSRDKDIKKEDLTVTMQL